MEKESRNGLLFCVIERWKRYDGYRMTGLESSIKNKEGGYKKDDERQIETMDFAVCSVFRLQ